MVADTREGTPFLSINGYGTLGVVHSNDDKADYIGDLLRPNGAGYTRSWSADIDSRIGLQALAGITPKLSVVVQLVSEQRYDNSYRPTTEWANVKYEFTPDFSVRIGRFVQPTFLFADTRKVAYTYPWVRPPTEVYRLVPTSHNDGVDVSYSVQFGELVQTLVASYGNLDAQSPDRLGGGKSEGRDTFSAMSTTEYGSATLRISYHQTHLTIVDFNSLFDAFRQFGTEGMEIADRYDSDGDRVKFLGIGINYDPGQWFVIGEAGAVDYQNVLGKSTAWYISAGYRFGTLTPYASFAKLNYTDMTSDPGLTLSSLPPHLVGPAAGLNAGLNDILGRAAAQETTTVGLRWDFMQNVALKLQYEFIQRDDGSPGTFGNPQPGFEPGGDVDLFSASINFVF
nr:porin [Kineobactrum salinum]